MFLSTDRGAAPTPLEIGLNNDTNTLDAIHAKPTHLKNSL